jgi:hypothetical protein
MLHALIVLTVTVDADASPRWKVPPGARKSTTATGVANRSDLLSPDRYQFTQIVLPWPDVVDTIPIDINNRGIVSGIYTIPLGVNNRGTEVGQWVGGRGPFPYHGYIRENGALTNLQVHNANGSLQFLPQYPDVLRTFYQGMNNRMDLVGIYFNELGPSGPVQTFLSRFARVSKRGVRPLLTSRITYRASAAMIACRLLGLRRQCQTSIALILAIAIGVIVRRNRSSADRLHVDSQAREVIEKAKRR